MLAKDIMTTDVVTFTPHTKVLDAMDVLVDQKISGAPVIDENGSIVGVLTEKDLLVSLRFLDVKDPENILVEQFMTREIVSFPEDIPVENVIVAMLCKNIKRVPIVKNNKLVGIVSRRDVLKSTYGRKPED